MVLFNLYAILKWFEKSWRFWVGLAFVCNIAYIIHLYSKPAITPTAPVVAVAHNDLLERIQSLEQQIQDHQKIIAWYDTYNQTSQTNFKRLDKNQQTQIDTLKRMCEYIWVITIDKKIVPRQCYPEYNWRREEINGN
jgi:hypothetical protein